MNIPKKLLLPILVAFLIVITIVVLSLQQKYESTTALNIDESLTIELTEPLDAFDIYSNGDVIGYKPNITNGFDVVYYDLSEDTWDTLLNIPSSIGVLDEIDAVHGIMAIGNDSYAILVNILEEHTGNNYYYDAFIYELNIADDDLADGDSYQAAEDAGRFVDTKKFARTASGDYYVTVLQPNNMDFKTYFVDTTLATYTQILSGYNFIEMEVEGNYLYAIDYDYIYRCEIVNDTLTNWEDDYVMVSTGSTGGSSSFTVDENHIVYYTDGSTNAIALDFGSEIEVDNFDFSAHQDVSEIRNFLQVGEKVYFYEYTMGWDDIEEEYIEDYYIMAFDLYDPNATPTPTPTPPINDEWTDAIEILEYESFTIDNTEATTDSGLAGEIANGVWYVFYPTESGDYTFDFRSSATPNIKAFLWREIGMPAAYETLERMEISSEYTEDSVLEYYLDSGEIYFIEVGTWDTQSAGEITIELYPGFASTGTPTSTPEPTGDPHYNNDNFGDARPIERDISYSQYGLKTATVENDEPIDLYYGKVEAERTIWFSWVADTNNQVRIVVGPVDAGMKTLTAVYEGPTLNNLTKVGENFLANDLTTNPWEINVSIPYFSPSIGTTYYIQVVYNSVNWDQDDLLYIKISENDMSNFSVPVNDDFEDAIEVNPENYDEFGEILQYTTGYTYKATMEIGEPDYDFYEYSRRTVWYKWVNIDITDEIWINTCGNQERYNGRDTRLDVYTGSAVDNLTSIASNDDYEYNDATAHWQCNWNEYTSFVRFTPQINTTYYIRVLDLGFANNIPLVLHKVPTEIPISNEAPYGGFYCSNAQQIVKTIPYGIDRSLDDEYYWSMCYAWCQANMTDEFGICQANGDQTRACWLNMSPVGGIEACEWRPGDVYGPDTWPKGTYVGQEEGYLLNLPPHLKATLKNNLAMDLSLNRITGQKAVYVVEKESSSVLAEVGVEFNSNRTWTAIDGAADKDTSKAFVHDILTEDGVVNGDYVLFVPIPDNSESNSVMVCPGVSSLEAINNECSNMEIKTLQDEGVSKVIIGATQYWRIEGVTGTGGLSLVQEFDLRDVMTRLKANTPSDHDIYFGTAYGIEAPGDTIEILMSNFDLTNLTYEDMTLTAGGSELTLGSSAGDSVWGVSVNVGADLITLTAPTTGTGYISQSLSIRLQIENESITNPVNVGMADIWITINNESVGGPEDGSITIPIVDSDQVNVTGYVNTFINFDIDTGTAWDIDCTYDGCLNHASGSAASNYTVDLGELSSTAVNSSGTSVMHSDEVEGVINYIYFDLTSNAINGVVVYMKSENGLLQGPGTSYLASVSEGNNILANSGLYGYAMPTNGVASSGSLYHDGNCDEVDEYCGFSLNLKAFTNSNGNPVDGGRFRMNIAAAASYVNNPGLYTDTLTFVAVPTY